MSDLTQKTQAKQVNDSAHQHQTPDVQPELEQTVAPDIMRQAVANPQAASPRAILQLQRAYGNRAVTNLIQPKLKVGPVSDKYEQEADRMADQVLRMPSRRPAVQRQPLDEDEELLQGKPLVQRQPLDEDEELLQGKPLVQRQPLDEDEELQMKPLIHPKRTPTWSNSPSPIVNRQSSIANPTGGFETNSNFERRLSSAKGSGRPLPDQLRADFEPKFGVDFGNVRVHTDSSANQLNRQINAQAFTHGSDIYFGAGKYNPGSTAGKRLVAHELTHTVQQGGGTMQKKEDNVTPLPENIIGKQLIGKSATRKIQDDIKRYNAIAKEDRDYKG
jgi:hypothetical protein